MSFSKISLWFCFILLSVIALFYYPKWNKETTEATISWDVSGYYWYLPAFLIYDDLKQIGFSNHILEKYRPTPSLLQAFKHPKGNYVMKYSSGQAVLMLPGFVAGHIAAKLGGYDQDGFSRPYQLGIFLWGLMITFIGLFYLRKILILYFSETASGLALITICFATNFLEYGAITNAMTHNYLFTLYALLIWSTIRFYKAPGFKTAAFIGTLLGIMALTRPTEIIAILIPISYGLIFRVNEIKNRLIFFIRHFKKVIFVATIMAMIGMIQLLYWKFVASEWLVYSYEEQGFSWFRPHIYDCLFSGRAGWLIYTPVMILSLVGFVSFIRKQSNIAVPLFLFSILFFYITFAWDVWWYGGSVSQRALVQLYPVLGFPLAAFYDTFSKVNVKAIIVSVFGLFCVHYNFWMTHHAHYGGLMVAGDMTSEYLKAIFLKDQLPKEAKKLLDTRKIFTGEIKDPTYLMTDMDSIKYIGNICLSDTVQFSPAKRFKLPAAKGWIRASADFYTDQKEWEQWRMLQLTLKYYKQGKEFRSDILRVQRHLDQGQKTNVWLDSKLRYEPDEVEIYFWNAESTTKICAENIRLVYHKG